MHGDDEDAAKLREEAVKLLKEAVTIRDGIMVQDDEQITAILEKFGRSLAKLKKFDEAEPVLRRLLQISERICETENERIVGYRLLLCIANYGAQTIR